MPDREDAQQRADQIRAFRAELQALESAGVSPLTDEQRASIGGYHDQLLTRLARDFDIDRTDEAGQLSRGMQIASFLGGVALTAAIYSLVSRYWGGLDFAVQAVLLAAFPLAALVGVELSARREQSRYVASLFALVAYGTFWLAAGVLSWTHNIAITPPVLWAGALFGLALALAYSFRVVLAVALATVTLAAPATVFQSASIPWTEAVTRPEMTIFTALLMTLLAPRLAEIHRPFGAATRAVGFGVGLTGLLLMTAAGETSMMPFPATVVEAVYQVLMLVVGVSVLVIAVRHHWTETVNIAVVLLTFFLLSRFVDWFWELLPRYIFFLLLAAIAFGWLLLLRRIRGRLVRRSALSTASTGRPA